MGQKPEENVTLLLHPEHVGQPHGQEVLGWPPPHLCLISSPVAGQHIFFLTELLLWRKSQQRTKASFEKKAFMKPLMLIPFGKTQYS